MTTKESILAKLTKAVSGTDKELYTEEELDKFASLYTDVWDDDTNEEVIAEEFTYTYRWTKKECRRCSVCGKLFREGYCQDGGSNYYCSKECLHTDFTDEEWEEECENNDQSYYTEWY